MEEINLLESAIKGEREDYEQYLNSDNLKHFQKKNDEYPIIEHLYNLSEPSNKERKESKIGEQVKKFETFKDCINKEKGLRKLKIAKSMYNFFQKEENKEIWLKIFTQDKYNWFMNEARNIFSKKKLKKEIIENLDIVLKYYKNYHFETKKEEIIFLENAIKSEEEFNYRKYLINLKEIISKNDRWPIIEYLFKENNKENNKNNTEKEIQDLTKNFEKIEHAIKSENINEITFDLEDMQLLLFPYFKDPDNKDLLLKIFSDEEINFFLFNESINDENISKLKKIKNYYEKFMFEEKEIENLKEIIDSRKGKYRKYLLDLDNAEYWNSRYNLIKFFIEEKDGDIRKNELEEAKQLWKVIERVIREKKSIYRLKNNKEILKKLKLKKNDDYLNDLFENDQDLLGEFNEKVKEFEKNSKEKKEKIMLKRKIKEILNYLKKNSPDSIKEINDYEGVLENINNLNNEEIHNYQDDDEFNEDYKKVIKNKNKERVLEYLKNCKNKKEAYETDNQQFLEDFDKLLKDKKFKKIKKHHKKIMLQYMREEEKKDSSEQYYTKEQREELEKS